MGRRTTTALRPNRSKGLGYAGEQGEGGRIAWVMYSVVYVACIFMHAEAEGPQSNHTIGSVVCDICWLGCRFPLGPEYLWSSKDKRSEHTRAQPMLPNNQPGLPG